MRSPSVSIHYAFTPFHFLSQINMASKEYLFQIALPCSKDSLPPGFHPHCSIWISTKTTRELHLPLVNSPVIKGLLNLKARFYWGKEKKIKNTTIIRTLSDSKGPKKTEEKWKVSYGVPSESSMYQKVHFFLAYLFLQVTTLLLGVL